MSNYSEFYFKSPEFCKTVAHVNQILPYKIPNGLRLSSFFDLLRRLKYLLIF